MKKEIRSIKTPVTVEKREDGTIKSIVGYPIVYNKDSEDMGFIERIAPGAATKALKKSDVRGLKNHDASLIFARTGVNLTLTEDKTGVRMEATPVDTHNFRETAKEVDLGLLDGQSFAFNITGDEWKGLDTDKPTRTITEFEMIFDVGPVTYPAYPDTSVGLRTLEEARKEATGIDIEIINEIDTHEFDKFVRSEKGRKLITDIILGTTEEVLTIEIKGETFNFTGEARFEEASEKIKSLRSDASPTAPTSDDTETRSDDHKDSDDKDEVLEKIQKLTERFKK